MQISANINAMTTQFSNMQNSAREIVKNPTKAIPEQIEIAATLKSNVSVVKTEDDIIGTLLDIKA